MNRWRGVRLVAGREVTERLRGRVIWIMTASTTLLVVAGIVVPTLIHQPTKPSVVALVGTPARALAPQIRDTARQAGVPVRIVDVASLALAHARLAHGSLDVAVTVRGTAVEATVQQSLSATLRAVLAAAAERTKDASVLASSGVAASVVTGLSTPVRFSAVALKPLPADRAAHDTAAIAAAILLWVSIGAYGGVVASGVAQEKTSRTAEVLLASLRPEELLLGKVGGIGLCGLGQMAVTVTAGLIANAVVHDAQIPSTLWLLLPAALLWFLLGYLLFATAFAAAGALVARQEEIQLVTTPFAMVLVVDYLLVYAEIASPSAAWLRILSFVPPLSPVLMPARIALGHVAAWETLVAVALALVAIAAISRLGSRIYAVGLMRSGPRLAWQSALAARAARRRH